MKKTNMLIILLLLSVVAFIPEANAVSWLTSSKVTCGNVSGIPAKIPEIISMLILVMQIVVPILLVIFGSIDLAKGVMSQKEDEIKKGQQAFIKRIVVGLLVFFIVALVKLLISVVGNNAANKKNIVSCIDCFVNNTCQTPEVVSEENN